MMLQVAMPWDPAGEANEALLLRDLMYYKSEEALLRDVLSHIDDDDDDDGASSGTVMSTPTLQPCVQPPWSPDAPAAQHAPSQLPPQLQLGPARQQGGGHQKRRREETPLPPHSRLRASAYRQ